MKDLIVLGGGASGFISAISYKKNGGGSTLIIEGNDRVLKKLSLTGNGQCNLSNMENGKYFGDEDLAKSVISKVPVNDTLSFFESIGVTTVVENNGKVYPSSYQASSVSDILRLTAQNLKIQVSTNELVTGINKYGDVFEVTTNAGVHHCKTLVYALGGVAYPKLLTSSSNNKLITNLNHTIRPNLPALCQIYGQNPYLKGLKGLKCNVSLSLFNGGKKAVSYTNEIHFLSDALSGPVAFSLSPYVSLATENNKFANLEIDFFPNTSFGELLELFTERAKLLGTLPVENFFSTLLHNQIGRVLIKNANLNRVPLISDLTDDNLVSLMMSAKHFKVKSTGTYGFAYAQSSIGGVPEKELTENLESKILPNLYFVGESVNVCGECGGYNLQWAWSSGILVGKHIATK